MADILLARPAAGTSNTVVCNAQARFVFAFPADEAMLSRAGDNLVITFEDGSVIQLENFYTAYSSDNMPSFSVEGAEISGEDFFMAMNEPDLMPAAGPARAVSQGNGNRFHDFADMALLGGLDRLGGLDVGWPGSEVNPDPEIASAGEDIDYDVTLTPVDPGDLGDIPVIDNPDNPHDGGAPAGAERDVLNVEESGLRGEGNATASGAMIIDAKDGVSTIVIGGVLVFDGAFTGNRVPTDEGYLEVTGFNADTGRLDYTYHLTQSTQEHQGKGEDSIAHDLVVTVTDTDGSTGSGVISVVITDDVPSIKSFTHEIEEGENAPIVGSALSGAVAGADGANFAWDASQNGNFGTITLNADGSYSYRLDPDNAKVKALTEGDTLTENFTYTYTDADEDMAKGSVTITINGVNNGIVVEPTDPDAGSDKVTVYESGLVNGSEAGDKPISASGSLLISAPDGVASIVIGGKQVVVNETLTSIENDLKIPMDEGTLIVEGFDKVTGELTFTYTLTDNTTEHNTDATDTQVSHVFTVMVTDMDGTAVGSTVTVTIEDDGPSINVTGLEGAVGSGTTSAEGSWTHDFGADLPGVQKITVNGQELTLREGGSVEVQGTYGTLTVNADGSYSYTAKPNAGGSDSFEFVITDADGDSKDATLTVEVEDSTVKPGDMTFSTQDADVAESGSDSMTMDLASGVTLTQEAVDAVNATIEYGQFSLSEDGRSLIFTQNSAYTHGEGEVSHTFDQVSFDVTDANGNATKLDVTVTIEDDEPSISIDTEATGSYGSTVTGSVDMTFGADNEGGQKSVIVRLNDESVTGVEDGGNYTFTFKDGSKLTLNGATGDFIYDGVPASGTGTSYTFTFTVKDADGDMDTATTTAVITPKVSYYGSVASHDNDILNETATLHSVAVPNMPGIKEITDGANVYDESGTRIGKFTLSGGTLFFEQVSAYIHDPNSNSVTLPQQISVTDIYGKPHIIEVNVTIQDSLPEAKNDSIELQERGEKDVDAQGNVLDNDTLSADDATLVTVVKPADGEPVVLENGKAVINGKLGTLTINADGTYTYKLYDDTIIPDSAIVREEFTYTIMDADGDTSTAAALTILVGKGTVHVKESGIGIDEHGDEIDVRGVDIAEGHVEGVVKSVVAGNTQYTDENMIPDKYKLSVERMDEQGDSITIHTNYGDLVVDKSTGNYRFELDDAAADPLPDGFEITQEFKFTTTVDGIETAQEVVVVIEGTNDAGSLKEAGTGGHSENKLWMDAKAEGADSVERPYDATNHPNLSEDLEDLGQNSGGTARPTTWLPFTLKDPDFGDSLTFQAFYKGPSNNADSDTSMSGQSFVSYQELLHGMESDPLSLALSVEWGNFKQNFTSEQLDGMLFCRTEYGIFAITNEALELKDLNNLEGAQYWLTFLVDSDADVIRQMAEGSYEGLSNGKILNFAFQVTDKTGNTVQTSTGTGGYADTNHVLVHVYGSNDTPEVKLDHGQLVVHDDDVNNFNNSGQAGGDSESHTITVEYANNTYTGTLVAGTVTLYDWSNYNYITCNVTTGDGVGTNFIISNFSRLGLWGGPITGQLTITITDKRGNSAIYKVNAEHGQLVDIPEGFTLTGTGEAENLYGGGGDDTLNGDGGNDSLWGGAGNDVLNGGAGNDMLYGESGNDSLNGGAGLDILVGGDGSDSLEGDTGNDVLIGDGQGDLQTVIEDAANAETFREFLELKSPEELESYIEQFETVSDGNDTLDGGDGNDMLFGMGGNDILRGGAGDDYLFGGSGDDYLDGGSGSDTIFAGFGSDIIVYDKSDYLVDGGSGIDVMIHDKTLSLDALLGGDGAGNGPIVNDVEVLITGDKALSLTSMDKLSEVGITITHGEGSDTLSLSDGWKAVDSDTSDGVVSYTNETHDLTVQIDVSAMNQSDVEQAIFILNNTNG